MKCQTPECERLPERNGKCSTCNREERRQAERAKRQKMVVKEIRKVSPKMAKALTEYSKLKKQFIKDKICPVMLIPATDIHHMKGRSSIELLLDTRYWLAVSREGHRFIEQHPDWAKFHGYSLERLAK